MLREQERQLENKVRREEEKLAALERKLENAAMEEEKRRERIAENIALDDFALSADQRGRLDSL